MHLLGSKLGPQDVHDPETRGLIALGGEHSIDIVHLVMKALPGEDSFRDIDFSRPTLQARWAAGLHDGRRALKHPSWIAPGDRLGMRVHELAQEQ